MISIFKQRNRAAIHARLFQLNKSWKTKRRIVVFESDDWGAIRTSNFQSYNKLKAQGYDVDKSLYMLDALERDSDLTALYETLKKHKNNAGISPKFTANIITANPDFLKIKENNYASYTYESVVQTCEASTSSKNVIPLWLEGIRNNVFTPQLHGREHVRYWEWMNKLQQGNKETITTFEMNMCGVPKAVSKDNLGFFSPVYIHDDILKENNINLEELIVEGSELFTDIFGFESKSTVAPNVAWTSTTESIWSKCNIDFIQGGFLQELHSGKGVKYIPRYLGEKNKFNQIYLVRNCTFEPGKSSNENYWTNTYKEIKRAFLLNTPALISTHRVNYIGAIKETNRTHGLKQLEALLTALISEFPDVEFMSSEQLGNTINKSKYNG